MRVYEINPNLILISNQTLRHYLYTDFAQKFSPDGRSSFSISSRSISRALYAIHFREDTKWNRLLLHAATTASYCSSLLRRSRCRVVYVDRLLGPLLHHLHLHLHLHWWPALAALSCYCQKYLKPSAHINCTSSSYRLPIYHICMKTNDANYKKKLIIQIHICIKQNESQQYIWFDSTKNILNKINK